MPTSRPIAGTQSGEPLHALTKENPMRKTMAILASAAIALSLTACGSEPPVATCSEYAQLAPDTGSSQKGVDEGSESAGVE